MATPGQWVPPLPAGWEARWDPNQNAYFFIDHAHKQTTWQDPRFMSTAQQQPQQHHYAAAQSLNPQGLHTAGGQGQNVAMSTMLKQFGTTTSRDSGSSDDDEWENPEDFEKLFASSSDEKKVDMAKLHEIKQAFPQAPEDMIRSLLQKHNNAVVKTTNELFNKGYKRQAVSHPPPRRVDMLERLKAMFPTANAELVEDMLISCNNDEKRAREQLESMGYTAKFPSTHRNPSAKGNRQASPARTATPASPARATTPKQASPAKPKISESEKQSLVRKLNNEFKSMEKTVIEMALQVCEYDEARAKNVLERMNTGDDSTPAPENRPSSSRARSPSPIALGPTSLEPVVFVDYDDDRPSTSTAERSPSRSSTPGVKKGSDSASRPATGKSSSRTPSPKKSTVITVTAHHTQQHRAKQVTHGGQGQRVVSRQPQSRETYVSQYRTEAKGPDPSLRVGPNKNLLLSEYTAAKGPNPEMRQGPDPSRVQGSQGAVGPDRSLHCGPNFNIRNGPNGESLLVTAI